MLVSVVTSCETRLPGVMCVRLTMPSMGDSTLQKLRFSFAVSSVALSETGASTTGATETGGAALSPPVRLPPLHPTRRAARPIRMATRRSGWVDMMGGSPGRGGLLRRRRILLALDVAARHGLLERGHP